MKKIENASKSKNTYKGVFIIFLLVCTITGIFCFQYYNHLQATIRGESRGYLQEITRRIGSNIDRIINDNYAVLNTLTTVLADSDARTFADVKRISETQQKYWDFLDILLIDEDGGAYNSSGDKISLNNATYFDDVVINKKQGISTTQMIDNKECIMLVTPLENMAVSGRNMVALAASYDPASFDQTLSMTSFSGQAYSCIISKSGTMVVRSSSASSMKTGYNVLTTIGEGKLESQNSMADIKKDIVNNQAGQAVFTLENERYYMMYAPVNPEDWYLLTFVPSKVVNAKSDMLLNVTLLICGLIIMVFAGLIAFILVIFHKNKRRLERIAYVDEVTGGHTIQRFYELAKLALRAPDRGEYALVFTNFQKFKVLNEQFGRHTCDGMLKAFYNDIAASLKNKECIGRLSADNFCVLVEYKGVEPLFAEFEKWYACSEEFITREKPPWALPVMEFGVYIIDNDTLPFPQMTDRAKLALRESPRQLNSKLQCAIYDDLARRRIFREKQLEDMMEAALKNREFQVYLQPKYRVDNKKIGGAEALVRWKTTTEGMIFPDEFIPVFEKNGFVVQIDMWVYEEVCRHLRTWIDEGHKPVKISVNCSRVHLKNEDFLKAYYNIAQKYKIPSEYIEIELTESIVMEDVQRLAGIIDKIHEMGFGCSMDDFGSGYSSLNLIRSIPVDTLKIDKIFFRDNTQDPVRLESVVGSIVSMAKALSMVTIAEGVEYPEQVKMLEKIGCDYIQGYVFAKPMPVPDFEKLAFNSENI